MIFCNLEIYRFGHTWSPANVLSGICTCSLFFPLRSWAHTLLCKRLVPHLFAPRLRPPTLCRYIPPPSLCRYIKVWMEWEYSQRVFSDVESRINPTSFHPRPSSLSGRIYFAIKGIYPFFLTLFYNKLIFINWV